MSRKLNYGGRGHLENNYFPGGGGQNYVLFPEGGLASNRLLIGEKRCPRVRPEQTLIHRVTYTGLSTHVRP